MADRLAEDGYRDAGYKYVSIDVSAVMFFSQKMMLFVGLSNLSNLILKIT